MGGEVLGLGQGDDLILHPLQVLPAILQHAGLFHKGVHRQGGEESGGAAGGQHVVRPCHVVPQRLRGIAAQEDGPGIMYQLQHSAGVLCDDLHVLRGHLICQSGAGLQVGADDGAAEVPQGLLHDLPAA